MVKKKVKVFELKKLLEIKHLNKLGLSCAKLSTAIASYTLA